MIQLNLLPDVKKEYLRAQRARSRTITAAILISIVAGGLTILSVFFVYVVQNGILGHQTSGIADQAKILHNVKDIEKYLTIQKQLSVLPGLHGSKNDFSRLLEFLPRLNPAPPQNVTLTGVDVNTEDNTITFKGTVNNYGSLTTFKDTLGNANFTYQKDEPDSQISQPTKLFSNVKIDSAEFSKTDKSSGVVFSVVATYDPTVFKQENYNVQVAVPNKETTSSVVGSPQAIFGGNQ